MPCSIQWNLYWLLQWTLLLLAPTAYSSPLFPGLKRTQLLKLGISGQWKNNVLKQRIKDNILRGLNISNPPFITPRSIPVSNRKIPRISTFDNLGSIGRMGNVSLILSEPSEPYKRDLMVFKIHSKVRSQLASIETPLLILRLRLSSKRKNSKLSSVRRKMYENICSNSNNSTSINNSTKISEEASKMINVTKLCSRLSKKRQLSTKKHKSRARKMKKRLRRMRSRKIRIVVRVVDPLTNKKRRVFVEKIVLKKSKTIKVPVDKNIFKAAAETSNHSLMLQVSCRNCKRYVKMDRVYRNGKKNKNNAVRLNPNRPYLYIHTSPITNNNNKNKNNNNYDIRKVRSKRHLSENSCSNFDRAPEKDILYDSDLECCEESNYYSFEDLGLGGLVLYPPGFNTVDCLGVCRNNRKIFPISKYLSTTGAFNDDVIDTSSTSERQHSCINTHKSALDILYFVNSNTVVQGRVVNFVGEACGCS